jgi:hypothetical protein
VISSARIRIESRWTPFAESLASTSFVRNPPPSHITREDISMSTCEGERSLSLTTEAITGFQIHSYENWWWIAATETLVAAATAPQEQREPSARQSPHCHVFPLSVASSGILEEELWRLGGG